MKLGTAIAEIMKREGIEILCGYRSITLLNTPPMPISVR